LLFAQTPDDQSGILQTATVFAKAFNKHDTAVIAAVFTEDADFTNA
jgi:ketosteroid isomerase-like protein